ncbi:MAG: hypothetical protein ACLTWL_14135 [Eubacterium callanderi]|uniref:hypothetical protein n=1 Tax=Eubacterium callanderi TaxID=53442 RepID=UPI0039963CB7
MEKKQCLATQGFHHSKNALRRIIHLYKSKPYPRAKNAEIKKLNRFVKLFINSPGERRVIRSLQLLVVILSLPTGNPGTAAGGLPESL